MKINAKNLLACGSFTALFSCQKENKNPSTTTSGISSEVISQIQAQGFSTDGIIKVDGGYVVENDIFLSTEGLTKAMSVGPELRVPDEEQYHTTNLISFATVQSLSP